MRRESPVWIIAGLVALAVGSLVGFGASGAIVILIAALGILFVTYLGNTMANQNDRAWLARWVAIGFAAKLAGTVARFVMVSEIYGIGDSFRYYRVGTELAGQWRSGHVP
ncbi:MAG: hypothetical protein WBM90_11265, partial [Acidimicrobiia bacterium]